jgi:hypothetical protein
MLQHLKGVNQCLLVVVKNGERKKRDVAVDCLFSGTQASAIAAIRAVLKKKQVEHISVWLFFQKLGQLVAKTPRPAPSSKKFSWRKFFGFR